MTHTNTVAKVAREATTSNAFSKSTFTITPTAITSTMMRVVIQGAPFFVTFAKEAGARFCFARPYIMRPAPYTSAFSAEMAAVMMTTFRIEAAAGMPRPSKICTNGEFAFVTEYQGYRDMMTDKVRM